MIQNYSDFELQSLNMGDQHHKGRSLSC